MSVSVSVKIEIEPAEGDLPGDAVIVETNSAWNGKIAIEVIDEIPGEAASVQMTVEEAVRLIEALQESVSEARVARWEQRHARED